jgi:hypothetical protein
VALASADPARPVAPRAVSPPTVEATGRDPDVERLEQLELAREQFRAFLDRAAGRDDFDEAMQRARERIADIGTEMEFLRQGIAQRRLEELGQKHPQ